MLQRLFLILLLLVIIRIAEEVAVRRLRQAAHLAQKVVRHQIMVAAVQAISTIHLRIATVTRALLSRHRLLRIRIRQNQTTVHLQALHRNHRLQAIVVHLLAALASQIMVVQVAVILTISTMHRPIAVVHQVLPRLRSQIHHQLLSHRLQAIAVHPLAALANQIMVVQVAAILIISTMRLRIATVTRALLSRHQAR